MFPDARDHRRTRAAFAAVGAALVLAAPTPARAQAADPARPLDHVIVERGGAGHLTTVFVHGTHGRNSLIIDWHDGLLLVRSLAGERVVAGAGCAWNTRLRSVACTAPNKAAVHLHGAEDRVRVTYPARQRYATEVWGGQGNDVLAADAGRRTSILLGGDDNDVLIGSTSTEGLWGGPGNDVIRPGGGSDHIDGGEGAFSPTGVPFTRRYERNDGECGARTHGFWDRFHPSTEGPEGADTLDLTSMGAGALADLNVCRLASFGSSSVGLVHAIEHVRGTRFNDRLVGDEDRNVLIGNAGRDWLTGEGGADRIDSNDGGVDTVKCSPGGDLYVSDAFDERIGC